MSRTTTFTREISQDTYNKLLGELKYPWSSLSDDQLEGIVGFATIAGYGVRSSRIYEQDGKYYLRYERYNSCD